MTLTELLTVNRAMAADRWHEMVLDTYPAETARLWKKNKNEFTNPVGATFRRALESLVEGLTRWDDATALCAPLEEIVRIRAVQDFTPGKALSFVFLFKKLLREVFAREIAGGEVSAADLAQYDQRVDNLALMSFDVYTKCREQLNLMRVEEFKRAHHMLFRKSGLMCDPPGDPRQVDE